MKKAELIVVACAAVVAVTFARANGPLSDDAMKERIVRFVTLPGRLCGHALVDFRDEFRGRKLTNREWFDGDTNRLARLIAELAQTNDVELSSQMVESLGEYGTAAQLPFLYSCATNPVLGKSAVEAVLRIEGVTSNSIEVVSNYLFQTNRFPFANVSDRSDVCRDLIAKVYSNVDLVGFRSNVLDMVQVVEKDIDLLPSVLDAAVISVDPDFQYSKRRLAILRTAMQRQGIEYQDIVSSNHEVWKRGYVHSFQTNYLQNAISELVAYPESNLPD